MRSGSRLFFILCLFALLRPTLAAAAPGRQETELTLSRLQVELWPDFDDRSVLALITGEFPATTARPITFAWPLPPGARVNVAARIDSSDVMIDDIPYDVGAGAVTITNPEQRFRLEYYFPYEESGSERRFTFALPAGLSTDALEVIVQQPAAATSINIEPPQEMTQDRGDTLSYLVLPLRSVAAAENVAVNVTYTVSGDGLTADIFNAPPAPTPAPEPARTTNLNWPLLIAGLAGLLISIFFIGSGLRDWWAQKKAPRRRRASRQPRPRPARSNRQQPAATVKFCHNCGGAAADTDRFCRACGTPIRGRAA